MCVHAVREFLRLDSSFWTSGSSFLKRWRRNLRSWILDYDPTCFLLGCPMWHLTRRIWCHVSDIRMSFQTKAADKWIYFRWTLEIENWEWSLKNHKKKWGHWAKCFITSYKNKMFKTWDFAPSEHHLCVRHVDSGFTRLPKYSDFNPLTVLVLFLGALVAENEQNTDICCIV